MESFKRGRQFSHFSPRMYVERCGREDLNLGPFRVPGISPGQAGLTSATSPSSPPTNELRNITERNRKPQFIYSRIPLDSEPLRGVHGFLKGCSRF